ncbi:MAG: hypothetical protein ACRD4S_07470 [Candidatus Acidiferrales bacterium]
MRTLKLQPRAILDFLARARGPLIPVWVLSFLSLFTQIARACPMCYQNTEASGSQGITALRHGILILFLPAASFFVGVFVLIYRRRNASR